MSHSQGTTKATRVDLVVEELTRIYDYHAQGNLPSAEEVLEYMDWRDANPL